MEIVVVVEIVVVEMVVVEMVVVAAEYIPLAVLGTPIVTEAPDLRSVTMAFPLLRLEAGEVR